MNLPFNARASLLGLLTLCALTPLLAGCEHDREDDETKVMLSDVPQAVRDTITREANGGEIKTIEREMSHGQPVYEADVANGKTVWEIKVDPTGKLLSKKIDDD